jgi:hypothetical protein
MTREEALHVLGLGMTAAPADIARALLDSPLEPTKREEVRIVLREGVTRRREFNLPGIQDLSKEQEDVRARPKQGQHLIIGGPGTGKSGRVGISRTRMTMFSSFTTDC